jgi:flagellar protein FlaG
MDISQLTAPGPRVQTSSAHRETTPPLPQQPVSASKPAPKAEPKAEPDTEQLRKAIEEIQHNVGTNVRFSVDKESGRTIVSVVDSETKRVVRQFPAEDVMKMARNIDRMQGLLFQGKA